MKSIVPVTTEQLLSTSFLFPKSQHIDDKTTLNYITKSYMT